MKGASIQSWKYVVPLLSTTISGLQVMDHDKSPLKIPHHFVTMWKLRLIGIFWAKLHAYVKSIALYL